MENTATKMEQLTETLNELDITNITQLEITETKTLQFQNNNISVYIENDTQYFKAADVSKALDITISAEHLAEFYQDEITQCLTYNKKGTTQLMDFLTQHGVYKFMYYEQIQSSNDLSFTHATEFKTWFANILNTTAIERYKTTFTCECDIVEPIVIVEKNVIDATRTCRTCKIQKEIVHYELANKKGDYKTNCIPCVDLSSFVCKKCNDSKIGTCYKFSENKIRQRTCNDCIDAKPDVFKLCKKCNTSKLNTLFGRYDSGDFHNECAECYKTVIKRDVKKCRKCEKLLSVDKYKVLDNGKRNRLCDACRG